MRKQLITFITFIGLFLSVPGQAHSMGIAQIRATLLSTTEPVSDEEIDRLSNELRKARPVAGIEVLSELYAITGDFYHDLNAKLEKLEHAAIVNNDKFIIFYLKQSLAPAEFSNHISSQDFLSYIWKHFVLLNTVSANNVLQSYSFLQKNLTDSELDIIFSKITRNTAINSLPSLKADALFKRLATYWGTVKVVEDFRQLELQLFSRVQSKSLLNWAKKALSSEKLSSGERVEILDLVNKFFERPGDLFDVNLNDIKSLHDESILLNLQFNLKGNEQPNTDNLTFATLLALAKKS
ncbi:MAG: hypothetical protein WCG27_04475, partial [Pseudomonadota bacterium]